MYCPFSILTFDALWAFQVYVFKLHVRRKLHLRYDAVLLIYNLFNSFADFRQHKLKLIAFLSFDPYIIRALNYCYSDFYFRTKEPLENSVNECIWVSVPFFPVVILFLLNRWMSKVSVVGSFTMFTVDQRPLFLRNNCIFPLQRHRFPSSFPAFQIFVLWFGSLLY